MQLKFISPNNFFYILIFFSFLNFGFPMLLSGFEIFTRFHLFNTDNWYFIKLEYEFILASYLYFFLFVLISFLCFKIFNNLFNKNHIKLYKSKKLDLINIDDKKITLIFFFLILSICLISIALNIFDGFILQIFF